MYARRKVNNPRKGNIGHLATAVSDRDVIQWQREEKQKGSERTVTNGVIRRFANNASEMKRLAARDFEDILQVCLTGQVANAHR
jgi:hypothetical protein